MIVIHKPATNWIYEFEVVTFWMTNENGEEVYIHDSYHTNGFFADQRASDIGGVVIHNVRIAGRKRSKHKWNPLEENEEIEIDY